jgi:hypothetical protein
MSPSTTRQSKTKPAVTVALPVSTGNLWLHELRSRIFGNTRLLRVWLPPDYDGWGDTRYPVLYLNDGQNLFDPATAFAGVHWRVGETATRLIAEQKIRPLIIVGIDNTKNRACEYIPYRSKDPRVLRPMGKCYPDFLQREVMPLIEERYSISKGPDTAGNSRNIWAITDRESVAVCGEPKDSEREHAIHQLARANVPGHGHAGNGRFGEKCEDRRRRARTRSRFPRGRFGRTTVEGSHRRRRYPQRSGLGGAVSRGAGVSLFVLSRENQRECLGTIARFVAFAQQ